MKITFLSFLKLIGFLLFYSYSGTTIAGINFSNINLDDAIELAHTENKLVFVDTYAIWCGPCKTMDQVLEENELGQFFNKNFINIKIDMDGPFGQQMLSRYEVVWLPTLLIIDDTGEVLLKVEKILTSEELLSLAKDALSGSAIKPSSSLRDNPFPESSSTFNSNINPDIKEEVIYVFDERGSSGRPHIMFHEAYLHLQLMDGRHQKVVKRYLSTQKDWSTDKNIKFIFDFLQDTNSEEFHYFIENKNRFEDVVGAEKVKTALSFLVNQQLQQGFPRPSLEDAERLYSYLFPYQSSEKAYEYYLNLLLTHSRHFEYIQTAEKYLNDLNPNNHEVIHQLVTLRLNIGDLKKDLNGDLQLMIAACSLKNNDPEYLYTLSKIYFLMGQEAPALQYINQSIDLASIAGIGMHKFIELQKSIKGL